MRVFLCLILAAVGFLPARAQDLQALEAPTMPFDFDNFRRTPMQARKGPSGWTSKDNQELQRNLISGAPQRQQDVVARASALFADPESIPLHEEPQPLPTPNQLTDQVTEEKYGETTKGPRDLLARARIAEEMDLASMSEADYAMAVARRRAEQEPPQVPTGEDLLRPMPSLFNSKTGGPPHAYAVSQAGIGARSMPRSDESPFTELVQALRFHQPVTKATDPWPEPSGRLNLASTPVATPSSPLPSENANSGKADEAKP